MFILAKFFIFVLLSGMVLGGKILDDSLEGGELFLCCFFLSQLLERYVLLSANENLKWKKETVVLSSSLRNRSLFVKPRYLF